MSIRLMHTLLRAALLAIVLTIPLGPAAAQLPDSAPAAAPAEATREQIDDLIATLEDEQRRAALIADLRLLLAEDAPTDRPLIESFGVEMLESLSVWLSSMGRQVRATGNAILAIPNLVDWIGGQLDDADSRTRWSAILIGLTVVLGAGILAFMLARALLTPLRRRFFVVPTNRLSQRLGLFLGRVATDTVPLVAFGAATFAAIGTYEPSWTARIVALALVNALLVIGAANMMARAVFTPRLSGHQLVSVSDERAGYLFRWIRRLVFVGVVGYVIAETGLILGLPLEPRNVLLNAVSLLFNVMLIMVIVQNRRAVAQAISGHRDTDAAPSGGDAARSRVPKLIRLLRGRLGDIWHVIAIAYVVVIYLIIALGIPGGFEFMMRATLLSALLILGVVLVNVVLRTAVDQLAERSPILRSRSPKVRRRIIRYLRLGEQILRYGLYAVAVLAFLQIWGIRAFDLLGGDTGNRLAASALSIVIVAAGALVAWELVSSAIDRRMARAAASEDALAQTARLRTLLPLLRNVLMIVLVAVSVLIVLSEIGIDIAPLLAGAGVIGLAIGFGAQTLVKDVITGLFNLVENTMQVGDVVNVAGNGGLVEGLTVRTVRLRDLAGNLYTIPFSEVTTVMNMTRDFSYYVFDIGVAYREDMDHVIEVVQQLGRELQEDPAYAPAILEPIEIMGVDAFADSAVILKARFKTKPIKQWYVGREFNRRMKKRFDELGIEIPFPHTTVYFGVDKQGTAPAGNLKVMAPELAEVLATRAAGGNEPQDDDGEAEAPTARRRSTRKKAFETPDLAGDSPAESDSSS